MDRREFMKTAGKATALAVAASAGVVLLRKRAEDPVPAILWDRAMFQVAPDKAYPGIVEVQNLDPIKALEEAVERMGGMSRFIKPGERVVVKPNVGWDRTPEQAANTNPLLVGAMVRLCRAAGAARVVVTDVTCNDARQSFTRSGIRAAAEAAGAEVVLPGDNDYREVALGGEVLSSWPVLSPVMDCDRLINMPIAKHHGLAGCTAGMKNLYGVLGGKRNRLHQKIDLSIVELAEFFKPTLTVVDATRVLLRGGPQGGSLDDVRIVNRVICSTDQVAADVRAAMLLDMEPENISYLKLASERGLGNLNYHDSGYHVTS